MYVKLLGAILIIFVCSWFGFRMASSHRKDLLCLKSLISILDYMECELHYRLTPLPSLCRNAAAEHTKTIGPFFLCLADNLDSQVCANVSACVGIALDCNPSLPQRTKNCLQQLGSTLGCYDLEGQIAGLNAVRAECRRIYDMLDTNKDARIRSYQVLGVCAGAALTIVLI